MLVPVVLWLALELAAGAVLALRDEGPGSSEWLVQAQMALQGGFFTPDEHALWVLSPNYRQDASPETGDAPLVLNEHGHRGPPTTLQKPPGVRRVLVLGGSHPFGMWVSDSQVYSAVLQDLLNAAGPRRWEVLNAASPGHTTFQGRQYLAHQGLGFEPDVVVFDLGMNDDLPLAVDFAAPDHEVAAVPGWARETANTVQTRSAVYRLLREVLARPAEALRPPDGVRVPMERRLENLAAARDLGAAHDAHVLFMSQVSVTGWNGPGAARCTFDPAEHGFQPEADVCGLFSALEDVAGTHFVDSVHATASGHRLIAELVFARMKEQGWLQ